MMNDILDSVLTAAHRSLVPFSSAQILGATAGPLNKRLSGSYIWTVILILPTAATAALAAHLGFLAGVPQHAELAMIAGPLTGVASIVLCDVLFWRLSEI